jgi:PKD repeat protein
LVYSYTDPLTGCTNQISHQVIINDPPNVFAGFDVDLCNQPIVEQLTGAIPGGSLGNNSSYYGLGPAVTAVTLDGMFDPSVTGPGTFEVVYAFQSAITGCIGRDTLEVTIVEPQVAEAGLDTVACFNAPPLVLAGFTPATGGIWFTQTPEDVPALVDNATGQILPQLLTPGDHQFYYSFGSGTCYTKDSLTVTIDPLPTISLGDDDVFCLNDTLMPLATASPSGGTWEGTGVDGTDFNTLVGAGPYDLFYWYEDPVTGCADTVDHHVTVQPLPLVNAGADLTLCDQPIPETLTGFSPPLNGPGGSGQFYGLGGAASAVTLDGTFDPSISGVGTFQVVYLYTSSITNCADRDTLEVTVVPPVVANAGLDTVVCANAPLLHLEGYFPWTGGTWSGVGAAASAVVDAAAGTLNPQLLAPGTYTFAIEVGTGTCYSTDQLDVTIDPLPVMDLGPSDAFCLNDTLMPLTWATPIDGTWEGTGVNGTEFNTLVGAGTYDLFYWYEDPVTGCGDTLAHEVLVNPLPVVYAGPDLVLCDQPIVEQLEGFSPGFAQGGSGFFYGIGDAAVSSTGVYEPAVSGVGTFGVVYEFTASATGCTHTDTLEVVVNPPVVADAGLDSVVCANAPLLQLEGYVPIANINWFSTQAAADAAVVSADGGVLNPQVLPAGDHVFSIEYGAGTCYSRDSIVVTVLALPQLTLGESNAWCGNDGVEVVSEALPAGGTWFGQGVVDSGLGMFDTDQPAATYAPGYTYTDPLTGCADTSFHQVTIHPVPVADFEADDLGCTNADLPLTQLSTGAVSAFWWFGDGNISYAWEPAHIYENAGFYTIEMVATTSFGCKDTLLQEVQITTPPTASATLTPTEGCAPLDVTFDNTSNAPFADFLWDIDGDLITAFEPNAMTFEQGDTLVEIPVSLTVENLCATSVYQDTVLVYPAPTLSFIMLQDTACSPFGLELLNTSTGMPDVLVWDLGNGQTYTGQQPPATWYTTGEDPADFTISLIGENECGTDSVQSVFHLLPNTVSAFFDASTVSGCAPLDVAFTDLSANTTAITFDFGNGLVSFDSLASTVYNGPGTYEVQQFVTNGCAYDTIGIAVEVFEEPEFSLVTNAPSYCVGEPVNFTVQASTSGAAEWAFGNGENGVGYFASTSYDEPGSYWAVAEVGTALFQCVGTDSVSVLVHPSPEWNLTVPEPGCSPFEAAFGNASAYTAFVTWNFGDGSSPSVQWAPAHEYLNTTGGPVTFEVSVHAESVNFCEADTSFEIGVLPAPVAAIQLGSAVTCDLPVELDLADASTGAVTSTWWFDGGLAGAGGVPDIAVTEAGAHEVVLEVENGYGCTDSDTAVFTVLAQPLAALDVFPVTGCQVLPVTFMNLSVGEVSTQLDLTSPSGSVYSGPLDDEATIDLAEPGIYTAQFVATSADGCTNALDVPQLIQVHPTPVANFESTPFIGTPLDINPLNDTWTFESTSVGASIWNWNFGDGGVGSGPEVSHTFAGAGLFTVTLIAANEFGCTDQRQDVVVLDQLLQVFVPNAFTPPSMQSQATGTGSRGLNDAFRPVFSDRDLVAEYEFTVINRWGDVVFHSFDPDEYWVGDAVRDGSHYAEDDVYVWTLYYQPTYEDIGIEKVGHVTLIRD